ncbi:hypothetical protein A6K24_13630 [Metabacillus litoralis]|uniref:Uncharacterized protein n=1 Tax=Metabacillus litoralis TaxID=152268 RepID=A0A179SK59_9BACI|nr:hypothetical protein A6K24_13630 [Metabacillus litoralis]
MEADYETPMGAVELGETPLHRYLSRGDSTARPAGYRTPLTAITKPHYLEITTKFGSHPKIKTTFTVVFIFLQIFNICNRIQKWFYLKFYIIIKRRTTNLFYFSVIGKKTYD